jgi:hypothetical protein
LSSEGDRSRLLVLWGAKGHLEGGTGFRAISVAEESVLRTAGGLGPVGAAECWQVQSFPSVFRGRRVGPTTFAWIGD